MGTFFLKRSEFEDWVGRIRGLFSRVKTLEDNPSGGGSNDASDLTIGTLPDARLSNNVALKSFASARANHTGVQAINTITGLQTALDEKLINTANFRIGSTGFPEIKDTNNIWWRLNISTTGYLITTAI